MLNRILPSLFTKKNYSKPEKVFWWWEAICNLRCNHCDIGKKTMLYKFRPILDLTQKKEVINKLNNWFKKSYTLSFIAGEPFLHKDIFDILLYASKKNAITSLTSNGTLIATEKEAERVIKSGLNFIAISLDSFTPMIHDQSRGRKGVWTQVMNTIKYLKLVKKKLNKSNPTIYINSILMRDNLSELVELIKWVKKENLDGITFQPIASTEFFGRDISQKYWYKTSPLWPNLREVLNFIDKIEMMQNQGFPIKNTKRDFERFRLYFNNPVLFGETESCEQELKTMLITHDGYVKMCPNTYEAFGNILKDDLDKIWNSPQAEKARKHIYDCKSQCKILATNKEDFYF